ncbi:MAG: ribbon-helix-helix protein, CopG family [Terracidiphilus sp.]
MRTTLTIDDDVAALLEQKVRRSGDSFKAIVNDLLRKGLMASGQKEKRKRFVVTPLPMGLPPGLSYDNIEELLEAVEGPMHK